MPSASTADRAGQGPALFQPDRFCDWLGRALSGRSVRCRAVSFRPDGTLAIQLGVGRHDAAFCLGRRRGSPDERWLRTEAPRRAAVDAAVGVLFPPEGATVDSLWQRLAELLAARLGQLVGRYHVPLFDLFAPATGAGLVTFAPGLFERRIGAFLRPGGTRIGPFVYVGQQLVDTALRYGFESAASAIAVDVRRGPVPDSARDARPAFGTAHLSAVVAIDERTDEERSDPRCRVEDYLGFLLSLADEPALRFRSAHRSRSVVVDPTPLEWGARVGAQFFFDEPGHDFLNLFKAAAGIRWPVATLFHGERECGSMGVPYPASLVGVVPSPLDAEPTAAHAERIYVTDLSDLEAIGGGEPKLRERLVAIASRPDLEAVLVGETCLARVLADDLAGCVEEARAAARVPIIHIDSSRMDHAHPFLSIERIWRPILEQTVDRSLPPDPDAVNLVGFGGAGSPGVRELESLLGRLGIRVNALLFPELESDHARRFCRARCHVVSPSSYVAAAFDAVARWTGISSIAPRAPYGRAGTHRWLAAVASELRGRAPDPAELPDLSAPDAARWSELVHRASDHGLAFVVPSTQARSLTDETVAHGVPLVPLVAELGFRLTLLVYDPPEAADLPERTEPATLERELGALVRAAAVTGATPCSEPPLRVVRFAEEAALASLLADPAIDLVYSEFRDDPRVRAVGKAQVLPLDFELGLAGALRSLERLVARARNPFHRLVRRYGRAATLPERP